MRLIAIITCMLLFVNQSDAQRRNEPDYNREFIWGITKATNSGLIGGLTFKYNLALSEFQYHGLVLDLVNIKHPQESRVFSNLTGNTFILGKSNYLYNIRLSYNREIVIFKKAPQQGVQINLIGSLGPTLGLESPYYIEIQSEAGGRSTRKVPFDYRRHFNNSQSAILGAGNIFQGLGESQVVPGATAKIAVAFEFGTFKSNVVGIETGFIIDAFSREIIIMPTTQNSALFPAVYATLFYGSRK